MGRVMKARSWCRDESPDASRGVGPVPPGQGRGLTPDMAREDQGRRWLPHASGAGDARDARCRYDWISEKWMTVTVSSSVTSRL
jgi:hypothetical protein